MNTGYFHQVARETPTRFWINNPTLQDVDRAIAAGAISCTTNPTFSAHMLKAESESEHALALIDRAVQQIPDDAEVAECVMQELVRRVMERFLPLYDRQPGREGLVSIQGSPHGDGDPDFIVEEAVQYRGLGKNFITKIPLNQAGLEAVGRLIAENMPIIATEVFAVDQAIRVCELYGRVAEKTGCRPPFYVTHITGIFDEYLAKYVAREGIKIAPEVLAQAACAIARKQYRIFQERGYPAIMLGGGARGIHHFTEMVGGAVHVTINWSTAEELIAADPPVVPRMGAETPGPVIEELLDKLPDFRKAYQERGLPPDEFDDFGPLQYFRDMFVRGWDALLQTVAERRLAREAVPSN